MHMAFWSPAWPLEKFNNGIITHVHWMKKELESQGHRVSVFTNYLDPSGRGPGIYGVKLSWSERLRRRARRRPLTAEQEVFGLTHAIAAAINRVHRRHPIDVIEMEETFGWFADVARLTSIPVVVKLHGPGFLSLVDHELDTPFAHHQIEREGTALASASTILSPSAKTLEQTLDRYRLRPAYKALVVNPVTIPEGTPLWSADRCDPDTILFVGRFDLRKGADIVLKSFRLLLDQRPGLKLIFVGPDIGIAAADGSRMHLAAFRDSLYGEEQRNRIQYLGRLPNGEIAALRTRAMTTLIASRWENSGYTLLEAMLQGCPVVSTDAGGCPESVSSGVTGLLARSGDPVSFAGQIRIMLDNPAKAAAMGEAARRHVAGVHSASAVAAASIAAYRQALPRSSGPAPTS